MYRVSITSHEQAVYQSNSAECTRLESKIGSLMKSEPNQDVHVVYRRIKLIEFVVMSYK